MKGRGKEKKKKEENRKRRIAVVGREEELEGEEERWGLVEVKRGEKEKKEKG